MYRVSLSQISGRSTKTLYCETGHSKVEFGCLDVVPTASPNLPSPFPLIPASPPLPSVPPCFSSLPLSGSLFFQHLEFPFHETARRKVSRQNRRGRRSSSTIQDGSFSFFVFFYTQAAFFARCDGAAVPGRGGRRYDDKDAANRATTTSSDRHLRRFFASRTESRLRHNLAILLPSYYVSTYDVPRMALRAT